MYIIIYIIYLYYTYTCVCTNVCIYSPQMLLIRFFLCRLGVVRNVATLEPFGSQDSRENFGVEHLKIQLSTKIIGIDVWYTFKFSQLFLDVKNWSCFKTKNMAFNLFFSS